MTVSVDLVSDIVCPWCWLGHRYWAQARTLARPIRTATQLRAFQLDPAIPREGVDYKDYMKAKFAGAGSGSGAERWKAMRDHLEAAGPDAGITFRFDEIKVRPNTLDCHRLIRWAEGQGLGEAMSEALFKAFFDELRDLSRHEVLAEVAGEVGLDAATVSELLTTKRDEDAVQREEAFYRNLGVQGVPCFIFNGQFAVSGAEAPEALAAAIKEADQLPAEDE